MNQKNATLVKHFLLLENKLGWTPGNREVNGHLNAYLTGKRSKRKVIKYLDTLSEKDRKAALHDMRRYVNAHRENGTLAKVLQKPTFTPTNRFKFFLLKLSVWLRNFLGGFVKTIGSGLKVVGLRLQYLLTKPSP